MKKFWLGFAACYALAGLAAANGAANVPATTPTGIVWAGVMWAPFNLLPEEIALKLVPSWAFRT